MRRYQVTYLISGPAHLPYLICSLYTLRKHWEGSIEVHCWPESSHYVARIAEDPRLDIVCVPRSPKYRKKDGVGGNSQFIDKIDMSMGLDCDVSLYLDADTTIHGSLDYLFNVAYSCGFCMTQWNDWTTERGHAHKRIKGLLDIDGMPYDRIHEVLSNKWPSVNGGVWFAKPSSDVLREWYELTLKCGSLFIADERVLHLMLARNDTRTITNWGRYNSSPKYKSEWLRDDEVRIWHYHGDSNVRPKKSQKGFELWRPIYQTCMAEDIGGISEWINEIDNRWLRKLIKNGDL